MASPSHARRVELWGDYVYLVDVKKDNDRLAGPAPRADVIASAARSREQGTPTSAHP
ncbi:MAG: hypothetical protein U0169_19015 [Polyangiaceae bacterium]